MNIPSLYTADLPLDQKAIYVLNILHKATVDEVAMEIMELDGAATEEGVAELTIATSEVLQQLQHDGIIKMETESDKQTRFSLKNK